MYRGRLWTMRQFAGFGTVEETNERFRYLLDHGQTGLSTAFDMPTLMGLDSDHPRSLGEVGVEGVALDTVDDMETLFAGIPLDDYGHFASVSSHSGPASLRRDFGLVVHWANITSAVLDLGGGTVYGAPNWDQARVSADNPVERIESYRNKRIFLVAGTSPDPLNWFDSVNETQVLAGQREFRERLSDAGIPFEAHEVPAATSSDPTCSSSTSTASSPGCATPAVLRLGVPPTPTRTWRPTNCIESTISDTEWFLRVNSTRVRRSPPPPPDPRNH